MNNRKRHKNSTETAQLGVMPPLLLDVGDWEVVVGK